MSDGWHEALLYSSADEYVPGVAIGAAHAIVGLGPKVGDWPLIAGHMGFHNWEYVTHAK